MIGSDDEDETAEADDDSGFLSKATEKVSEAAETVANDNTEEVTFEENVEPDPIFEVSGSNADVELYNDRVFIERTGAMSFGNDPRLKKHVASFSELRKVEYKETSLRVTGGWVRFDCGHDIEQLRRDYNMDVYKVKFRRSQSDEFEELKRKTERAYEEYKQSESESESDDPADADGSKDDTEDSAVQVLREKYATGEISKEEFEERMEVLQSN